MKNKNVFLLSLATATISAFILPQIGQGYGIPINWITYKGDSHVINSFQLLSFKYFKETQFNLALLLLNSLIFNIIFVILYKVLKKMNKD